MLKRQNKRYDEFMIGIFLTMMLIVKQGEELTTDEGINLITFFFVISMFHGIFVLKEIVPKWKETLYERPTFILYRDLLNNQCDGNKKRLFQDYNPPRDRLSKKEIMSYYESLYSWDWHKYDNVLYKGERAVQVYGSYTTKVFGDHIYICNKNWARLSYYWRIVWSAYYIATRNYLISTAVAISLAFNVSICSEEFWRIYLSYHVIIIRSYIHTGRMYFNKLRSIITDIFGSDFIDLAELYLIINIFLLIYICYIFIDFSYFSKLFSYFSKLLTELWSFVCTYIDSAFGNNLFMITTLCILISFVAISVYDLVSFSDNKVDANDDFVITQKFKKLINWGNKMRKLNSKVLNPFIFFSNRFHNK